MPYKYKKINFLKVYCLVSSLMNWIALQFEINLLQEGRKVSRKLKCIFWKTPSAVVKSN